MFTNAAITDTTLIDNLTDPAADTSIGEFAAFGPVHLDVSDGERALGFWRDLVGLTQFPADPATGALVLGAGEAPLVVLHPGATRPVDRHATGLYHLALHMPTLADYLGPMVRLARAGYPQAPTDHITHLASYADDPDGNGLELVFETPDRFVSAEYGPRQLAIIDAAGRRRGGTEAIDPIWLRAQLASTPGDQPLPPGTKMGHMHLRVADVDDSVAFYRDQIGFTTNMHIPGFAMFDMGAGGRVNHRLAGNVWESRRRGPRTAGTAGLREYTIVLRDPDTLAATLDRLHASGHAGASDGPSAIIDDPSAIRVRLVAAA